MNVTEARWSLGQVSNLGLSFSSKGSLLGAPARTSPVKTERQTTGRRIWRRHFAITKQSSLVDVEL